MSESFEHDLDSGDNDPVEMDDGLAAASERALVKGDSTRDRLARRRLEMMWEERALREALEDFL